MTAGTASKGLLRTVFGNPWVALTLGAVAGYYGYKYRKEIAAAAMKATDMGKDYVLQQKESLSDLVEEAKEAEETKTEETH
jgi:chloramphenicol 3-O-phosphotransferase